MDPNSPSPQNSNLQAAVRPVSSRERIVEIDILRGWAIFGMLLVNMGSLGGYWMFPQRWTGTLDRVMVDLITILAEDKFFTLFSFLFGLGFAVQICRAEAGGSRFVGVYLRRLVILLLIGLLALFFLAPVLILQTYALVGFLLLLFRRCRAATLLRIALVCLVIPAASEAVVAARTSLHSGNPQLKQQMAMEAEEQAAERAQRHSERVRLWTEGTYSDLMLWRTRFAMKIYTSPIHYINILGGVFPILLLGLWAGRRRIFEQLSEQLRFVRRVLWWSMGIGFAGTLASFALQNWFDLGKPEVTGPVATLLWRLGQLGLCFFYAASLVTLAQRQHWKRRLAPLAAVGRMALSNYLFQLVLFAILLPAYGLGLFGRIGPALGVAFTLLVFGVQILCSVWWIRRFRFGPAEWLWRALTYGKLPPIRSSVRTGQTT